MIPGWDEVPTNLFLVCAPGGYLDYQGYDISPAQSIIPRIQHVLHAFREAGFPVYHTREGEIFSHYHIFT